MTTVVLLFGIILFAISVLLYFLFSVFAHEKYRNALIDLWWKINHKSEATSQSEAIDLANIAIDAWYMKDGEVSNKKLIQIAFVVNFLAAIVYVVSTMESPNYSLSEDMEDFSFPALFVLGMLGVYLSERVAIGVFLKRLNEVEKKKRLRFLAVAFAKIFTMIFIILPLCIIMVSYGISALFDLNSTSTMVYGLALTQYWSIGAIAMPITEGLSPLYALMALPAGLSVFLPMGLYLTVVSVAFHPKSLGFTERILDFVSSKKAEKLRNASLISISVIGSILSVVTIAIDLFD